LNYFILIGKEMLNKKIITLGISVIAAAILTTGCANSHENTSHSTHKAHWGYTGHEGPAHWGDLDEKYHMCKAGNQQSPINIDNTVAGNLDSLAISYTASAEDIINNGHTVQVNINNGSTLTLDGTKYSLKQFHFHTPSENNIRGNEFALEAHFVHATEDGHLAVIGVMFEEGDSNNQIGNIWSQLPKHEGKKETISFDANEINKLLPNEQSYYHFMGSLTTPPCSENVKWYVMKKPLTISKAQKDTFFNIFGHSNNRPVQPTNGRTISE
jgi:carbonic anhydrase